MNLNECTYLQMSLASPLSCIDLWGSMRLPLHTLSKFSLKYYLKFAVGRHPRPLVFFLQIQGIGTEPYNRPLISCQALLLLMSEIPLLALSIIQPNETATGNRMKEGARFQHNGAGGALLPEPGDNRRYELSDTE
jgi:hypothetical protein